MRIRLRWLAAGIAGLGVCGGPVGSQERGPPVDPPQDEAPADNGELTLTETALAQLSAAYSELTGLIGQEPADAVDWAQTDIENIGDWEYRIVVLPDATAEVLEASLNELGEERWEVYWVEGGRDETRFFLKRPAISYLSRLPLSALLRILAGGGQ